ncbi:uncharacterized protein LOC127848454 isoform X3 [Dreissena polymorpha]|uniref:uncharacterized protein LOC127848454 isoform X3 n=1 Tax=Dreissena polymorpha TaxID=45954 RepID=UPI00226519A5|nr:uncharacterized protein LOC127848454 isoform X3 [Dreissena polymorpha]
MAFQRKRCSRLGIAASFCIGGYVLIAVTLINSTINDFTDEIHTHDQRWQRGIENQHSFQLKNLRHNTSVADAARGVLNDPTVVPVFYEKNRPPNITVPIKHKCSKWFEATFEDNLRVISGYLSKHMTTFPPMNRPTMEMMSFPVIVTACSHDFFHVSEGLLKSIDNLILPKYPDLKLFYYDLGLHEQDIKTIESGCKFCTVIKFDFQKYPQHVQHLKFYAWKPLIVREVMQNYSWVWWMDSSARILRNDTELDRALQYSKENSILFFTYGETLAVARHTHKGTMSILEEDYCKFRYFGEIEASFVLFHFDSVSSLVVDKWSACASLDQCMNPRDAKLSCHHISRPSDGQCHRYDQSVLSILLRRLYHDSNDYPLVSVPIRIHELRRGSVEHYFSRLSPKKRAEI